MIRLSININKIATLRNARGGNLPDVVQVAKDIEKYGADGITVHPRPDQRHIRYSDILELSKTITTEFNIEGNPSIKFMDLVLGVRPTQVTLVPDGDDVITSNAGWDTKTNLSFLKNIISKLKHAGIRSSIFVEPIPEIIHFASLTGTDRIELYTQKYASEYLNNRSNAILPYIQAAEHAARLGLEINAGHDLNSSNLNYFAKKIPKLKEVSIGHALISESLYLGFENVIGVYKECLNI
ncbi:MAG: pyridoxine 5'-phosphate synthase [Flavobacteriaceae bacterium]|nr:pyridoxine 5'-phosphate synthase [Flavobacteriaceae bacterium]|tara:strand:- start:11033 stop:11749 length:717 start_codon:yes stop_codon:yes gene_type:complete